MRRAPAAALFLRESPGGPGSGASGVALWMVSRVTGLPSRPHPSEPAVSRPGAQREVAVPFGRHRNAGHPSHASRSASRRYRRFLIGSADPVGRTNSEPEFPMSRFWSDEGLVVGRDVGELQPTTGWQMPSIRRGTERCRRPRHLNLTSRGSPRGVVEAGLPRPGNLSVEDRRGRRRAGAAP